MAAILSHYILKNLKRAPEARKVFFLVGDSLQLHALVRNAIDKIWDSDKAHPIGYFLLNTKCYDTVVKLTRCASDSNTPVFVFADAFPDSLYPDANLNDLKKLIVFNLSGKLLVNIKDY